MRSTAFFKHSLNARSHFNNFWAANKTLILVFIITALLGLLIGLFTGIKSAEVLTLNNAADFALIKLFKYETSFFGFFMYRFLIEGAIILAVCLLCNLRWGKFLIFPLIGFLAYQLGLNCVVFVMLFGFGGVINVILAIFPCQLLFILIFIIGACYVINRCEGVRYAGYRHKLDFLRAWAIFLIPITIVCILQTVLLSIFAGSFIFAI